MKKLMTILLSVLLIASSVLTVNTVRADEFEEEATVENVEENEFNEESEEPVIEISEEEPELNNDGDDDPQIISSVVQANNGDLIFTFADSDWLIDFSQDEEGELYIESLVDNISGWYSYWTSDYCPNESFVINTVNNTVTVPFNGILTAGIPAGEIVYEFDTYESEPDSVSGTFTITQGAQYAPSFTITENATTGDIEIICSDEDFIDALLQTSVYNSDYDRIQTGAEIVLLGIEHDFWFGNSTRPNNSYTRIYKSDDGTKAYIPNSVLLNTNVINNSSDINDCYEVEFRVPGYAFTAHSWLHISQALTDFDPSTDPGFSISLNGDGDLIVTSSNDDWLEAIAKPSVVEYVNGIVREVEKGGKLWLSVPGSNHYFNIGNGSFADGQGSFVEIEYNESTTEGVNSYIRIDRDHIVSFNDFSSNDYIVGIEPYKYTNYEHPTTIYIEASEPEEPVVFLDRIEQVISGDIKIYFSDASYLSYVNKDSFHLNLDSDGFGTGLGFNDYGDAVSDEDFEIINNQYILIPYEKLLVNGVPTGTYTASVFIDVEGEEICNEASITLTKGAKALPSYTISEDAQGNINIVSSDTSFIQAIAKAYTYDQRGDVNTVVSGSTILFNNVDNNFGVSFKNLLKYWSDNTDTDNNIVISSDGHTATIPARKVLGSRLPNNSSNPEDDDYYYSVYVDVYGYERDVVQLHLEHACEDIDGDFDVEFDSNGNMIITSEDTDWLEALASPRVCRKTGPDNNEVLSEGSNISFNPAVVSLEGCIISNEEVYGEGDNLFYKNTFYRYIDSEDENEDPYVFVPRKTLSYINLADGDFSISLSAYGYVPVNYSEEDPIHLEGYYGDAPNDVRIYQDSETYDVIVASSNRAYIEELCSVFDETDQEYSFSASHIEVEKEPGSCRWVNNFTNTDGTHINLEFVEGSDENEGTYYAVWSYDRIAEEKYALGQYEVNFVVCGYGNITRTLNLEYGAKEFPTDIQVELNSDKDLVFTIPDEDLLTAFAQFDGNGEPPHIEIYDDSWNCWFNGETIEIDVENETLIIRDTNLRYNGVTGVQNILMCAPGYIDHYIYNFNFNNGLRSVPSDLRVSQDANGNLKIQTSDTRYLRALMTPSIESEDCFERFSGIEYGIYNEEWGGYSYSRTIENYVQRYDGQENYEYYMSLSKTTLTISKDTLIDSYWISGNQNLIEIHADGYKVARKYNVTLNNLGTAETPSEEDFSAAYVAGTGLVITCNDPDYLAGMVNMNDYRYDSARVEIVVGEDDEREYRFLANYDTADRYQMNYYVSGNTVVVPEIILIENELEDQDVTVCLVARGYINYWISDETVSIPHLEKAVPNDVTVSFNDWGDLIVSSADDDFLEALAKPFNYVNAPAGEANGGIIGIGEFDEEDPYNSEFFTALFNNYGDEFVPIISEEGCVKIFSSVFKIDITQSGIYDIILYATGYEITHFETYVNVITPRSFEFGDCMYPGQTIDFDFESDYAVTWSVANVDGGEEILAAIDQDGVVTAYKTGAVVVKAIDTQGNADSLYIEISEYVPAGIIAAGLTGVGTYGFEKDDTAAVEVTDNGETVNPYLFDYVSGNDDVVTVNSEGEVTAVGKGTTTITVLFGGSENVAATVRVTVIDRQVDSITVYSDIYEEETTGIYVSSDVSSIQLSVSGKDKLKEDIDVSRLTYVSSDTAVATVDKNGLVSIKKAGQFTITATTSTNVKAKGQVSDSIVIRVLDYTPILESDKVTVNRYQILGSFLSIYAKYAGDVTHGSSISSVSFEGTTFTAVYSSTTDQINIRFNGSDADKNKTYIEKLNVSVSTPEGVVDYSFQLKITLTSTLPGVTVKATGTYNTFTSENTLKFTATAKDANINDIGFEDDFAEVDANGNVTVNGSKFKGNALIYVDGYSVPVKKAVTFKTTSTQPKITLDKTSQTLFVPEEAEDTETRTVVVHLKDASKNIITEGNVEAVGENHSAEMDEEGNITLTVPAEGKGATYRFTYRDNSWAEGKMITYSVKVTINKKIPTAKLAASTVTLNTHFDRDTETLITTSSGDLITSADVVYAGKSDAPEGLNVSFDEETQTVSAVCEGTTEPGTYKYSVTPTITVDSEEYDLKPVTVSVKVDASVPTVTFKSTSAKFNIGLMDEEEDPINEEVTVSYTVKNNRYGIDIEDCGFKQYKKVGREYELIDDISDNGYGLDGGFADGKFFYTGVSNETGKKEVYIQLVFEDLDGNEVAGNYIKFTPTFYSAAVKASVSVKGNLNQLDPDAEAIGTVKYTNLIDTVESVELNGLNKDNFTCEVENGKLVFKLTEAGRALRDGTYKADVKLTSSLGAVCTVKATVKLARKAPTLKLAASSINVYDMTAIGEELGRVKLNQTGNGTIAAFWTTVSYGYELRLEGDYIVVYLVDAAKIKAGSTSSFTIKIDWEGDYGTYADNTRSIKTTSLSLKVVDCSGKVKAR